jgi:hypothetical protein
LTIIFYSAILADIPMSRLFHPIQLSFIIFEFLKFPGGFCGGATPVPIPNTEVKTSSADGTASRGVWESRTPPGFILSTGFYHSIFIKS